MYVAPYLEWSVTYNYNRSNRVALSSTVRFLKMWFTQTHLTRYISVARTGVSLEDKIKIQITSSLFEDLHYSLSIAVRAINKENLAPVVLQWPERNLETLLCSSSSFVSV